MNETRIPIGQFADLTWLSPKALRLHQAQGLPEPVEVDLGSGYRHDAPSPIPAARPHRSNPRSIGGTGHGS